VNRRALAPSALALAATLMLVPTPGLSQAPSDIATLARSVANHFVAQGALAEREGRPIAAESFYARAIAADRTLLDGYLGLARALRSRHRADEALAALESASNHVLFDDDDAAARWARAMAALGGVDRAIRGLTARTQSPRNERLIAELYAAGGRLPEALAHARRAADLAQGDPAAERDARRLARAIEILVGELDAVRAPGPFASSLRRVLSR
jgi:tetratricopeptide (TPR) repeat protein